MAKAYGQTIPPAMSWWYTRILGETKFTGWRYFPDQYMYGYGGTIGKRIPFRLPHSQGLYGKKVSAKQRNVRIAFKNVIDWWGGQIDEDGAEWPEVGQRDVGWWYSHGQYEYQQMWRYFVKVALPYCLSGEYVEWASLWYWMACPWDMLAWGHDWGLAYFLLWGGWIWKDQVWRSCVNEDWFFVWKKLQWYKIRWGGLDSIHFMEKWGSITWMSFVTK